MPAFDPPPERRTGYSTADGKRVVEALEYLRPIAHVPFTSPITVSAGGPTRPTDVLSLGAIDYEAGTYKVEFFAPQATAVGKDGALVCALVCALWDDTMRPLGRIAGLDLVSTAVAAPLKAEAYVDLDAGSHTLRIRAYCAGGDVTIHAGRGGRDSEYLPGFVRITRDIPIHATRDILI